MVGKPDRDRVNVEEEYELQAWSEHFGTTRERLREAVRAVGPMANDVDTWLSSHQGGTRTPK